MSGREPAPGAHDAPGAEEAAPVVSEGGPWDAIPNPFDEFGPGAALRDWAHTFASALLIAALAAWLAAFSLAQATSEAVALPALERAVVALTEVDALLAVHADEVREQAAAGGGVTLPGFPLAVSVPAAAAADADGEFSLPLLRGELVARGVRLLRAEGGAAFRGPDGAPAAPAGLSGAGLTRRLADELGAGRHERWRGLVAAPGYASLALAAAVLVLGVGFGRLSRVGAAMLIAGALVLAAALLVRAGAGFAGGGDAVAAEARAIVRALAGAPIRNALWLAAGGAAIALPAAALGRLFDGSERRAPR